MLANSVADKNDRSDVAKTLIQLTGVSVRYGIGPEAVLAVNDLDLSIPERSFVSLIGPSGCGKSSVLNLIAGYHRPTTGSVRMAGVEINGPGPDRMVVHQQTTALLPWLNVERNVELALQARNIPKAEIKERARHFLGLVDLSGFEEHAIYQLSGGMRQRLALARALATEAQVILLDEPLGAIDALQRSVLQDLLLKLWYASKSCFVLITHSVEEAVYLSTHVVSMSARPGRIIDQRKLGFGRAMLTDATAGVRNGAEFSAVKAELFETLIAASSSN